MRSACSCVSDGSMRTRLLKIESHECDSLDRQSISNGLITAFRGEG